MAPADDMQEYVECQGLQRVVASCFKAKAYIGCIAVAASKNFGHYKEGAIQGIGCIAEASVDCKAETVNADIGCKAETAKAYIG